MFVHRGVLNFVVGCWLLVCLRKCLIEFFRATQPRFLKKFSFQINRSIKARRAGFIVFSPRSFKK